MQITSTDDFMVIDFRPTGEVEAMHRDKFNLSFLGKQTIQRASDIRFNDDSQQWDIHLAVAGEFVPVEAARGFDTYEEARKMEVRWLEMARLHDITPLSDEGTNLLRILREKFDE